MFTMSAQTVLDSVNKYRHGVLIGNFVEDQFGNDLAQKGPNPDEKKLPTTKDHHDLNHSLYQRNQIIEAAQPVNKTFYKTAQSQVRGDYIRPQQLSSYNIFYQPDVPVKFGGLQNNAKKQQALNRNDQLYDQTRYNLANKFGSKDSKLSKLINQQIPDILTGQIYKSKKEIVLEDQNENRHLTTNLDPNIAAKSINPYSTYSLIKPKIKSIEEVEYKNLVLPNQKGEHRDVLFGHGLNLQDFQKRQLGTSYDLSYNQRIKPQTQVNSFYEPGVSSTSQHFHRQTLYQKNHQANIPSYGTKQLFYQAKAPRPYQPYTGSIDQNHLKHEYLRK